MKDNGKKDCGGQVTKVPRTTTNYIRFLPQNRGFVMCAAEDGRQCFGPFVRMEGNEI